MIEGLKILMMRMLIAVIIVMGLMPIYHSVYTICAATNPTYATGAMESINSGVEMIYPISMLGIAIAVFHTYYRAVQKRQYESAYQETQYYDPYQR
jgi:hypothetical protein